MKSTSHKTWQTPLLFLELLQIQNLKRKSGRTWHIISSHLKKWGGHVPRVPHRIAPIHTHIAYQSSLQRDFCIPNQLVTRPVTLLRWGFASLEKLSPHLKKCLGHIVYISIVFVHAVDIKFGLPQKLLWPPGVPSWLRVCWWLLPCDFCQLCHWAQSFHNQIFQV